MKLTKYLVFASLSNLEEPELGGREAEHCAGGAGRDARHLGTSKTSHLELITFSLLLRD